MHLPIPVEQLKKKLTEDKLITPEEFDVVVAEAERNNQEILDLLVSEKGIGADYLSNLLADFLGVEVANLDVRAVDEQLLRRLPEDIARQRQAIVFKREADNSLGVAMADPSDLDTVKFLTQYLKTHLRPYLAFGNDLNRGFSVYGLQTAGDFKKAIEENVQASLHNRSRTAEEAAADLPIVSIIDNLLSYAVSSRASDVHIEILDDFMLIRYRIDGILYEVMRIPKAVHPAIVARIKVLSGIKIDEHYKPQDGRFRYQIVNQTVDVRVSALPTYYGEKIVMRLLPAAQKPLSLEELGMLPGTTEVVQANLKKAFGMILVTGPTGSGKSTTLYAILGILNKPDVNIITIEDPVEYNIRYVNQSQINIQAGITFASGLRAILRQDPNIIMVGEIRDSETADISVQASLTGHLLLSTLHTNDAITAIPRLTDLQVPSFLVGAVLNIIIAQRLVRRVCSVCIYSYPVEDELRQMVLEQLKEVNPTVTAAQVPTIFYRGKGCAACGFTGYRGRWGIFEVLEVDDKIKKIVIDPKFSLDMLRQATRAAGMRTMFEDGVEKAQLGMTTIEEVLRVIRE